MNRRYNFLFSSFILHPFNSGLDLNLSNDYCPPPSIRKDRIHCDPITVGSKQIGTLCHAPRADHSVCEKEVQAQADHQYRPGMVQVGRSRSPFFHKLIVVGLLIVWLAGCTAEEPLRSVSLLDELRAFQGPTGPDVVQMDVALVEQPAGDAECINGDLWILADEQAVPLERKALLEDHRLSHR